MKRIKIIHKTKPWAITYGELHKVVGNHVQLTFYPGMVFDIVSHNSYTDTYDVFNKELNIYTIIGGWEIREIAEVIYFNYTKIWNNINE